MAGDQQSNPLNGGRPNDGWRWWSASLKGETSVAEAARTMG
jgi:hypothetical protein